jgi:hypothetical protein
MMRRPRRATYAPVPRPAAWDRVLIQVIFIGLMTVIAVALGLAILSGLGVWG